MFSNMSQEEQQHMDAMKNEIIQLRQLITQQKEAMEACATGLGKGGKGLEKAWNFQD